MVEKKRVLVTGADGFIAGHLILQLLAKNYLVRGTLRNLSFEPELRASLGRDANGTSLDALELCQTDLLDDRGWSEAVDGVDAVLHVASPFPSKQPKDEDVLIRPARDGALRVLRAAKSAGVRRIVLTSSVVAIGFDGKLESHVFDERDWSDPTPGNPLVTPYARSKTLAEQAAWDFARAEDLAMTTIHPSLVCGPPFAHSQSTSVGVVKSLLAGEVPIAPPVGFVLVDVRDVAAAHVLALENDAAIGERYIAADRFLWMMQIAELLGRRFPEFASKLPKRAGPAWFFRLLMNVMPDLRSLRPELGIAKEFSSEKARKELGWKPRPVEDTLVDTARALLAHGHVKRP